VNVYLAIKYHPDARNRTFVEELSAQLASRGHDVSCVARDIEKWGHHELAATELMEASFRLIDASDLVLVELSEKGVGLGIESGYAFARGIPVMVAVRTGSDVSTTLRGISAQVVEYAGLEEVAAAVHAFAAGRPSSARSVS